ncbi:MAG: hypothetical protein LVS60_00590 [Nodosilinea sp. LVE1205-7]|jgi:hypothetical protein
MFLDELTPIAQQLLGHPVAFLGGFTSGLLRLNLAADPVKSWLHTQGVTAPTSPGTAGDRNGRGPQSISID